MKSPDLPLVDLYSVDFFFPFNNDPFDEDLNFLAFTDFVRQCFQTCRVLLAIPFQNWQVKEHELNSNRIMFLLNSDVD